MEEKNLQSQGLYGILKLFGANDMTVDLGRIR